MSIQKVFVIREAGETPFAPAQKAGEPEAGGPSQDKQSSVELTEKEIHYLSWLLYHKVHPTDAGQRSLQKAIEAKLGQAANQTK